MGGYPSGRRADSMDYTRRFEAFMEWAGRVNCETRLLNPFPVVRWNGHKSYLLDFDARGVPMVPTTLFRANDARALERLPRSQRRASWW